MEQNEIQNRITGLRTLLGKEYCFRRYLTTIEYATVMAKYPEGVPCVTAASLTVGCVMIQAAIFKRDGKTCAGYDVFIRESLASNDWICYDSPEDEAVIAEGHMLKVLERVAQENGLSYTDCSFERLIGKEIKPGDKDAD